ncbi:hypothetical protein PS870_02409 [Pseudomonas fluorescens]|uniref:Uncharacterized protein n=1 Tax=Pseudomonas fluorescens TaxID=294 RepID=A0A5E7JUT8_PSEFL|nr:hypothetical protein [Pseudomonas fluorescens]VVO92828.1 hypothetical protein PS870_02409 [Pseudomonas fluorescens]
MLTVNIYTSSIKQKKANQITNGASNELYIATAQQEQCRLGTYVYYDNNVYEKKLIDVDYNIGDICGTPFGKLFTFYSEHGIGTVKSKVYGYELKEENTIELKDSSGYGTSSSFDFTNGKIYSCWNDFEFNSDNSGVSIINAEKMEFENNIDVTLPNRSDTVFYNAYNYITNTLYLTDYNGWSIVPISIKDSKTLDPIIINGGGEPAGTTIHETKGILFVLVYGGEGTFVHKYDLNDNNNFLGRYRTPRAFTLLSDEEHLYVIGIETFSIYSINDDSLLYSKDIPNGAYFEDGASVVSAAVINKLTRTIHMLDCNGIHGNIITIEISD